MRARTLLESEPRYGSARFVISWTLRQIGDHEKATAEAQKAVDLRRDSDVLRARGTAHAAAGAAKKRVVCSRICATSLNSFVSPHIIVHSHNLALASATLR